MNYATIYNLVCKNELNWGFDYHELTSTINDIFDYYDLDAASRYQPVQGLFHLFTFLKSYKTALISNSGKKGVEQALSKFGLENSFGFSVNQK